MVADHVGQTIWDQISTGTKMAIAARDPVAIDNGLQFKITAKRGTHKFIIKLNARDYYDIRLVKIGGERSGFKVTEVSQAHDVGAENLSGTLRDMQESASGENKPTRAALRAPSKSNRNLGLVLLAGGLVLFLGRRASGTPPLPPGGGGAPFQGQASPGGSLGTVQVSQHHTGKFPGNPIYVSFTWTAATKNFLGIGTPWDYRIRVLFGHSTVLGWRKSGRLGFAEDGDRIFGLPNRANGTYPLAIAPGDGLPNSFPVPFIAPDDPGQSWDIHVHLEAARSDAVGNPIPNDWVEIGTSDHNGAVTTMAGSGSASVDGSLGSVAVSRQKRLLGRVRR